MEDTTSNIINISINPHLVSAGYRFIKVAKRDKKAIEERFQSLNNYSGNEPTLLSWLGDGGNYGVLCSRSNIAIDLDHPDLIAYAEPLLKRTFKSRSGSGRGPHFFYICTDEIAENIILVNPKNRNENWGNIQSTGKFVVGPGSIHPSGNRYEVIDDIEVAEITFAELKQIFEPYIKQKRVIEKDDVRRYYGLYTDVFDNVSLADVGCFPVKPINKGNNEIQGEHPIHGSSGGQNFSINTHKNLWHCWRHDSGGGPLEWLAVAEGIINCDEAGAGCLRGENFRRVLEIAKEKGIKISLPKRLPPARPKILTDDTTTTTTPRPPTPPPDTPCQEIRNPDVSDQDILAEWYHSSDPDPVNPEPESPPESPPQDSPLECPPEPRIVVTDTLPDKIPDADIVLLDAPPRLGKTHRVVTWATSQCKSANMITTSHSIVEQQLRIFRENKNEFSTAIHLEGKDRCCLKKEREKCKLCEYYPFDGENFLDIRQHVKDQLFTKKILTKENVNTNTGVTYCPYYILKAAEPFADYVFTVVANVDRVTNRDYMFIDEDPSIAHWFANSVDLLEASFHQSHVSASSKLEERWIGIEKYKEYLSNHRHEGKKVLMRCIEILEQFRAILTVENMTRETKQMIIEELSRIDTTLPPLTGLEPHELIDHVKRFEIPDTFSPYVEALLFQYTPKKFVWSGSNPSTLHLVAIADQLIRPAPEGKLVVIGSTRAELFVRALNRNYKVIRIPRFPYSNWFSILVIREETSRSGKKLMENVLKKLSRTNEKHRYPVLVLTGSEKHQKRLKTILGGIAHCSSDENQVGQMWNKRGGFINIFYQNSVISRGIDVDFYNMLFCYSSDFANPYWSARLQHAHEERDIEDAEFSQSIIDAITVDETTNSLLRISPVRSTQDSVPRVVVICDTDLWKIKPDVVNGSLMVPVDADFFDKKGWERILENRKIGLYDIWHDPSIMSQEAKPLQPPDMTGFERVVRGADESTHPDWKDRYSSEQIEEIYNGIRAIIRKREKYGRRVSQKTLITSMLLKNSKKYITDVSIKNSLHELVLSGEIMRENGMGENSLLSLRERHVLPAIEDSGQFEF